MTPDSAIGTAGHLSEMAAPRDVEPKLREASLRPVSSQATSSLAELTGISMDVIRDEIADAISQFVVSVASEHSLSEVTHLYSEATTDGSVSTLHNTFEGGPALALLTDLERTVDLGGTSEMPHVEQLTASQLDLLNSGTFHQLPLAQLTQFGFGAFSLQQLAGMLAVMSNRRLKGDKSASDEAHERGLIESSVESLTVSSIDRMFGASQVSCL